MKDYKVPKTFMIEQSLAEKVEQLAKENGYTFSSFVRACVIDSINDCEQRENEDF